MNSSGESQNGNNKKNALFTGLQRHPFSFAVHIIIEKHIILLYIHWRTTAERNCQAREKKRIEQSTNDCKSAKKLKMSLESKNGRRGEKTRQIKINKKRKWNQEKKKIAAPKTRIRPANTFEKILLFLFSFFFPDDSSSSSRYFLSRWEKKSRRRRRRRKRRS